MFRCGTNICGVSRMVEVMPSNSALAKYTKRFISTSDQYMTRRVLGLALIVLLNFARAGEPSLAELSAVPMALEVNGVILTARALPYFNLMPRPYSPGELGRASCERDGRFIVPVTVVPSSNDDRVREAMNADRVWVVQGENVWHGSIKDRDRHAHRSYGKVAITFVSRGCGEGIKPYRRGVVGQAKLDAPPRAYAVIRLHFGEDTFLLRSPESTIGSAM